MGLSCDQSQHETQTLLENRPEGDRASQKKVVIQSQALVPAHITIRVLCEIKTKKVDVMRRKRGIPGPGPEDITKS